jgi:hypothetical protein
MPCIGRRNNKIECRGVIRISYLFSRVIWLFNIEQFTPFIYSYTHTLDTSDVEGIILIEEESGD